MPVRRFIRAASCLAPFILALCWTEPALAQPTCTINGPDPVCAGAVGIGYNAMVMPGGGSPVYSWSITGNGSIVGSTTSQSVNVTAGGEGSFTLQLNGTRMMAPFQCSKTVTVNANPTCSISGPDPVCSGTAGNIYTSTVSPAGGTVTYSWSITGNGSIAGSSTGSPVSVTASAAGSFTLTLNVTRNGCLGSCQKTVTVSVSPTCTISGADPVCTGSTGNTYTSTVSPAGGTVAYSWSISGNGSIVGSTTSASVNVTAGAAGSFTLTLSVTRNGCLGSCQKTVTVDPNPTCTIGGAVAVCTGSTDAYTSTVSPSGGIVTYSWSISGNGSIVGSGTGPSVNVTAGAAGSYTVNLNVTRDGCPGFCSKTVTVNPSPVCLISGQDPVCDQSTHTYLASAANCNGMPSYAWSVTGNGSMVGGGGIGDATADVKAIGPGGFVVHLTVTCSGCVGQECTKSVTVNPSSICSISGQDPVCDQSTHTYTASVANCTGTPSYAWSVTGNGSIVSGGGTGDATAGVKANGSGAFMVHLTVTCSGCPGEECTKFVTVSVSPTCAISGAVAVCTGSTDAYTSTVSPSGGIVTYSWSISGNGSIVGSGTGPSVNVTAGAAGSYTVNLNVTRDGCPGFCSKTVTVNPSPVCLISGQDPVCDQSTHTYLASAANCNGMPSYAWSVTGNGSMVGGGGIGDATVDVHATGPGGFVVHLTVTCSGCVGQECTKSVTVNPSSICSISGQDPVCDQSTHTYTASVANCTGTPSYAWSVTGNGSIVSGGGTGDATAGVKANGSGAFMVHLTVTCSGCPGEECTKFVTVSVSPTCAISGAVAVCTGSTDAYTSTVSPSGGIVTYSWSISGNGSIVGSGTGPSVNVTAGAAGSYTVNLNVTRDGCPGFCSKTVTVNPNPTCSISGPNPAAPGSTGNVYTSSISPSGGTVTYSWSIAGNGTIVGPSTSSSVTITAGVVGSFTLNLNVSRDGCLGSCSMLVSVQPICSITGANAVCENGLASYTSTVSPAGGTLVYSWSVSGNGSISGGNTNPTVLISALGPGSFTLTLTGTRSGAAFQCQKVVTVNALPACTLSGRDPVATTSTQNTYTASLSPSGGAVAYTWSITGSGSITTPTNAASVTVTAGPPGSFTLHLDVTREGCPGSCQKLVTVRALVGAGDDTAYRFRLSPSQNPFAANVDLYVTLDRDTRVVLDIFDLGGRKILSLLTADLPVGEHEVSWNGRDDHDRSVVPGVYFARLETGDGRTKSLKLFKSR